MCRKRAFVNRRGAKKPNKRVAFVLNALGKAPSWEDVRAKRERQSQRSPPRKSMRSIGSPEALGKEPFWEIGE